MYRLAVSKPKLRCCMLFKLRVSSPAAHNSTSERAACMITNDFCPSVPFRPVERPAPRKASAGFVLAVIHAGAIPKRSPVKTDVAKANARTGSEGDAWIGTYSFPKARRKIMLVPPKAIAIPANPPMIANTTLSVSAWRTRVLRGAPKAARTVICCLRAVARTSIRFARFAQAINNTKAEIQDQKRVVEGKRVDIGGRAI